MKSCNIDLIAHKDKLTIVRQDNKQKIFDPIRKKYLVLQPEEFVRQLFLLYLIDVKKYPPKFIRVEQGFQWNKLRKRADIIVYDKNLLPFLIVECKSHTVKLSDEVFSQAASYNMNFNLPFLAISNGKENYCCEINKENNSFHYLEEIPEYPDLR